MVRYDFSSLLQEPDPAFKREVLDDYRLLLAQASEAAEDEAAVKINGAAGLPLTAAILTLGKSFEAKLENPPDETHKRLGRIAAQVFMQTAVGVTSELAVREAEPEGFELGPAVYISSCPEPELPAKESTAVPLTVKGTVTVVVAAAESLMLTLVIPAASGR